MSRILHRWAALPLALVLSLVAISGAWLSLLPLNVAGAGDSSLDLGQFAAQVVAAVPATEQIRRTPAGQVTAVSFDPAVGMVETVIDQASGAALGPVAETPFATWVLDLHRALFLGDAGRIVVIVASLAMVALVVSGLALAARRMGGWRAIFLPVRGGAASGRWHLMIARLGAPALVLSSLTALWMAGATFGIVPEGTMPPEMTPVSGTTGMRLDAMSALAGVPVTDLLQLQFPRAGDANAIYTLETTAGIGYIDQGTGALLGWADRSLTDRIMDTVHLLHTGEGAALLGLLLGLSVLAMPLLSGTGIAVWLAGRSRKPKLKNTAAEEAETIVLVGSEGGTTWEFARALQAAITAAGGTVHLAPMSDFEPARYRAARRVVVMAASYGDGDAPASAKGFLDRVGQMPKPPAAPLAVLGFGDRAFPKFCAYAEAVARAAEAAGWHMLMPMDYIDAQAQAPFKTWVGRLADAMGVSLDLHAPASHEEMVTLQLISRRDFGAQSQAPTSILRFQLPRISLMDRLRKRGFARFAAGDLLGVLPVGDSRLRYYSLASGMQDGFVEICVRKQPGGLCSGQLTSLNPGDQVRALLRPNPGFHAAEGPEPLILIGAGAGVGPLAGFARANRQKRPIHLYFGTRSAEGEMLFGSELTEWRAEGRLASLTTAFSRSQPRTYVQDALRQDGARVASLIAQGARVMICGGRDMALGVAEAFDEILAPMNLNPVLLKAEGRYVEDIF
ncbi:PepSY domain-containing protein [Phaeovulum sp.]|uniref:PepSY domain-containing protein n=1 Tax=Phaeovulum sp. TaxID=2934796 RepID=UPI00356792C0